jgi:hypothetical protein
MLRMLALITLVVLLPACRTDMSPSGGLGDPYPAPMNDPQIAILSPELRPWLGFHPAVVVDDGERPMHVQIPVRNLTDRDYLIDYRVLFFDANGIMLEPIMGWKMEALRPKQTVRLDGKAMDTQAVSYRLEVKWAR